MNLTIRGLRGLVVTPALRAYALNKIDPVTRHFDGVITMEIVLSVDMAARDKHKREKAEINLHVGGRDFNAEHVNGDLYAAIDKAMTKLDRQLAAHKDQMKGHRQISGKRLVETRA